MMQLGLEKNDKDLKMKLEFSSKKKTGH